MQKSLVLAICFILIGILTSFSATSEQPVREFGFELSQITYKEPGVMKEQGKMTGFFFSYANYDSFMLKSSARYSGGQVDYSGSDIYGAPVTISNIGDYSWELRLLGGKRITPASPNEPSATTLYAFTGIAYRYLNDAPPVSLGGYERESNYIYSPFGIEIRSGGLSAYGMAPNEWTVGATLEYDAFWQGKQISHLSDYDPGLNDITSPQKHGYGYRADIKLQNSNVIIAPFIRYWSIGKSEVRNIYLAGVLQGYGYEPKNNSTEIGLRIGFLF